MGAPSGKKVLVQRATKNEFNVIVAPGLPYGDVEVSMKFKPIAGREDASGGIVFRFTDGKYYVVRANALEDNFRLYSYDRGRRQLATASVRAPALGQWHTVRLVVVGDHMQAWLDGKLYLDHRDALQVRARRALDQGRFGHRVRRPPCSWRERKWPMKHVIVLLGLMVLGVVPVVAWAADPDWKAVEQALGKPGQLQAGDVFRVRMPPGGSGGHREGRPGQTGFALGSYAASSRWATTRWSWAISCCSTRKCPR